MENMDTFAPAPPPAPQAEPRAMSVPARLIGVFYSPTETFNDIVRRPRLAWLAPLIVLTIVAIVTSLLLVHRITLEQLVRSQIAKSSYAERMTPEQMEKAVERGVAIGKYQQYLGGLLAPAVLLLIYAGLFALMANFVLGAEVKYSTLLGTTAHGMMPGVVSSALMLVTVYLKDPADIDIQDVLLSNLGFLFSSESHKVLHRLASSIDIFSFWQIALMALGVAAAARFSFKKGLVAVMAPWAVWVFAAAGLAALF
jgi:hypothetical protein